jgi:hypothetical protein
MEPDAQPPLDFSNFPGAGEKPEMFWGASLKATKKGSATWSCEDEEPRMLYLKNASLASSTSPSPSKEPVVIKVETVVRDCDDPISFVIGTLRPGTCETIRFDLVFTDQVTLTIESKNKAAAVDLTGNDVYMDDDDVGDEDLDDLLSYSNQEDDDSDFFDEAEETDEEEPPSTATSKRGREADQGSKAKRPKITEIVSKEEEDEEEEASDDDDAESSKSQDEEDEEDEEDDEEEEEEDDDSDDDGSASNDDGSDSNDDGSDSNDDGSDSNDDGSDDELSCWKEALKNGSNTPKSLKKMKNFCRVRFKTEDEDKIAKLWTWYVNGNKE